VKQRRILYLLAAAAAAFAGVPLTIREKADKQQPLTQAPDEELMR